MLAAPLYRAAPLQGALQFSLDDLLGLSMGPPEPAAQQVGTAVHAVPPWYRASGPGGPALQAWAQPQVLPLACKEPMLLAFTKSTASPRATVCLPASQPACLPPAVLSAGCTRTCCCAAAACSRHNWRCQICGRAVFGEVDRRQVGVHRNYRMIAQGIASDKRQQLASGGGWHASQRATHGGRGLVPGTAWPLPA